MTLLLPTQSESSPVNRWLESSALWTMILWVCQQKRAKNNGCNDALAFMPPWVRYSDRGAISKPNVSHLTDRSKAPACFRRVCFVTLSELGDADLYRDYTAIMDKKMETAITYWGNIRVIVGLYWDNRK